MNPLDRHGIILRNGDVVHSVRHNNAFFVIEESTRRRGTAPAIFLLSGRAANGRYFRNIKASTVMFNCRPSAYCTFLADKADFCGGCRNYFEDLEHHQNAGCREVQLKRAQRLRGVIWCIPRFLRWKHRALTFFRGSLSSLLAEGVKINSRIFEKCPALTP